MRNITLHIDTDKTDFAIHPSTGFLIVDAKATRAGVFDYSDGKGGTIRELRSSEEVFHPDSLESLKFAPLTRNHPTEMVTTENAKRLQIGMVGENVRADGDFVKCTIVIQDKDEIEKVKAAKERGDSYELSCGYDAKVVTVSGEHHTDGHYDAMQTNIRYNHLAAVDKGRAGREVKLILDEIDKHNKQDNKEVKVRYRKVAVTQGSFRMDAIEGEVADDSMPVVNALEGKLDEAVVIISKHDDEVTTQKKGKEELQGKHDALKTDNDKLTKELTQYQDVNSPKILDMVKQKQDVDALATKAGIKLTKEDGTAKTLKELKVDIIGAASSGKFDAEGKDDAYIDARFDQVVELAQKSDDNKDRGAMSTFLTDADKDLDKDEKSHRDTLNDEIGEAGAMWDTTKKKEVA